MAGAVLHAWTVRQQLYPTMVLLTTSKILLVILGNFALSLMLCLGKAVKATFLGPLRESEVEVSHRGPKTRQPRPSPKHSLSDEPSPDYSFSFSSSACTRE